MRVRKAVGPYAPRRKPQPARIPWRSGRKEIRKLRQESFTQTVQRCAGVLAEERPCSRRSPSEAAAGPIDRLEYFRYGSKPGVQVAQWLALKTMCANFSAKQGAYLIILRERPMRLNR